VEIDYAVQRSYKEISRVPRNSQKRGVTAFSTHQLSHSPGGCGEGNLPEGLVAARLAAKPVSACRWFAGAPGRRIP